MILKEGYYLSGGTLYEEWHAGIHMKYKTFNAYSFGPSGKILIASKKFNKDCENPEFIKSDFTTTRNMHTFKIQEDELLILRENNSLYTKFRISNSETLMDEYDKVYVYTPWDA